MTNRRKWKAAAAAIAVCLCIEAVLPAGALAASADTLQPETAVLEEVLETESEECIPELIAAGEDDPADAAPVDTAVPDVQAEPAAAARATDTKPGRVWVQGYSTSDGTIRVGAAGVLDGAKVFIDAWLRGRPEEKRTYEAFSEDGRTWMADVPIADFAYQEGWYDFAASYGSGDTTQVVSAPVAFAHGTLRVDPADNVEAAFSATLECSGAPQNAVVWVRIDGPTRGSSRVYPLLKRGDLRSYKIFVKNHAAPGVYTACAFLGMPTRVDKVLATAQFRVDGVRDARLNITNIDGSTGAFSTEFAAQAPSGISIAKFAVWSAPDRSDLKWYDAAVDNGVYRADMNVLDHSGFGQYTVQTHVRLGNGITMMAGEQTAQIDAHNYLRAEPIGNGSYQIAVLGADASDPALYRAAVWSDENGQDDLVWYDAADDGEDGIRFLVSAWRHASAGKYIAHVYCGQDVVGSVEFDVPQSALRTPAERRIAKGCQSVYDEVGTDLHDNYMWVVNNISYVRRSGHLKPPEGYTREQWYAVEGFEKQTGNCYTYAAAFCELAKGLGYNAEYVEGAVFGVGQQWWPHGFVLIERNGSTYICDPELQYASSSGRNLYMQPISSPKATYRW